MTTKECECCEEEEMRPGIDVEATSEAAHRADDGRDRRAEESGDREDHRVERDCTRDLLGKGEFGDDRLQCRPLEDGYEACQQREPVLAGIKDRVGGLFRPRPWIGWATGDSP